MNNDPLKITNLVLDHVHTLENNALKLKFLQDIIVALSFEALDIEKKIEEG